ncbi:hypothetical protein SARC_04727 [Sphaeroforma arctica JP610]|uniref:DUF4460 domain-containing protein n=1 Tax=Sphaeroforma arctica JP610 TaxID=667725 RepID=A0A0L0G2E3_9EUKA|nr:hypothetical protein SARC_04727 [Sphaeroforma arctica JP610]KNC83004.1 hypothetical protein SARC_04727 [Sphaeroforma arctica JP610]|eukprot:XP_014156906.1 hypothetical protein SARC_04727 [Sphaeroforma arctica JP610]
MSHALRAKDINIAHDQHYVKLSSDTKWPTFNKLRLRTTTLTFPKQKKQNETSLQKLLSFIDEIKSTDSFPSRQTLLLTFEIPRGRSGAFKTINLKIRTSGGDCRRVVEDSILQCFNECDLNIKKLTWHEKYWNPKLPDRDEYYEYEE